MKFASIIAEKFAEENELTLIDFQHLEQNFIYKRDVISLIISKKRILAKITKVCPCCKKNWPTIQALNSHMKSNVSLLYLNKIDLRDQKIINQQLSNQVSVLEYSCKQKDLNIIKLRELLTQKCELTDDLIKLRELLTQKCELTDDLDQYL